MTMMITMWILTAACGLGLVLPVGTVFLTVTQPGPGNTPEVRTSVLISRTNTAAVYNKTPEMTNSDQFCNSYIEYNLENFADKDLVGRYIYYVSGTYCILLAIRLCHRDIVCLHHTPSRKEYTESPSK
jgi:hypothetical protein